MEWNWWARNTEKKKTEAEKLKKVNKIKKNKKEISGHDVRIESIKETIKKEELRIERKIN